MDLIKLKDKQQLFEIHMASMILPKIHKEYLLINIKTTSEIIETICKTYNMQFTGEEQPINLRNMLLHK